MNLDPFGSPYLIEFIAGAGVGGGICNVTKHLKEGRWPSVGRDLIMMGLLVLCAFKVAG